MKLVVPVVTLWERHGEIDDAVTRSYAQAFTAWSVNTVPLLYGSTGSARLGRVGC